MSNFEKQSKVVPSTLSGARLDKAVKELFDVPWSKARTWIERGKIFVSGEVTIDNAQPVAIGVDISCRPNAPVAKRDGAFDPECIVYKDTHLIIANKPADILTVPFEKGDKDTFDQQLRSHLFRTDGTGKKRRGALASLMVVHRLDKLTSGLLVFPRTWAAKESLASQFRQHTVDRQYLALVHGKAKPGTIRSHIMTDRGDGIRGSSERSFHPKVRKSQKGQLAITHVHILDTFVNATLVACRLDTGRTNQIRIHMAEQGCPLIGERTYMRGFKGTRIDSLRLMLHAARLGFDHPVTGEHLVFDAPAPAHFTRMHHWLRDECQRQVDGAPRKSRR